MMSKLVSVGLLMLAPPALGGPLLTGVVEDIDAQIIEMPALPGVWQRRVDWMIQEGGEVAPGDLVVRLDPGDLISREEQAKTDLLKVRLLTARRIDELKLDVLDKERLLAESKSNVRLAELDASIPKATIPQLDYERYKLTLEIARKNLVLTQADLRNKLAELDDVIKESELEVRQAESNYERIRAALKATEIRAEKAGFVIYGENRVTGRKVFPGETLYGGFKIASVASRQDLQIRFWIHEADILKVQNGQHMSILADAQGVKSFGASVTWISSQAVQKQDWSESGYYEALARPTNGVPDSVMPGMSVMGELMDRVND